jgi:hypothetical protein
VTYNALRFAAALFVVTCTTACERETPRTPPDSPVIRTEVPADLFVARDQAVAYRASGSAGARIENARLPIPAEGALHAAMADGLVLVTQSNGRYRAIRHRMTQDAIIADVIADKTYVVAVRPAGHLRTSLAALCGVTIVQRPRPPRVSIPKICTQIFCTPYAFTEGQLYRDSGMEPSPINASTRLGGWISPPGGWCAECTGRRFGDSPDSEPTVHTIECPRVSQACETGQSLLRATFDADTLGGSPSTSPGGDPVDDQLNMTGSVKVVTISGTNKGAQLDRTAAAETSLVGEIGTGASTAGAYCMGFRLKVIDGQTAISVRLLDDSSRYGWQLRVDHVGAQLVTPTGSVTLPVTGEDHVYRFDVDLDLRRFDVFVDGTLAESGIEISESTFAIPHQLRFSIIQAILEAFPGAYVLDDISLRKTS